MSVTPISGCLSSKQISQLNDRLNELGFEFGSVLDTALAKILNAEFEICDASDIPQDTGGVQQFLCITDGVCTFFDKSEIVKLNETVTTISYDETTNTITYVNEAGDSVEINLNVGEIRYDDTDHTIRYTDENGDVVTIQLNCASIEFDAATCELKYEDEKGVETVLDLNLLDSRPPSFDDAEGVLTFTNAKGVETDVRIGQPYTPPPSCFYVDGDKTQGNAANKICDALANGKAIAFTDGSGSPDQILTGYDETDIVDYIESQGGTNVDTNNWTWQGSAKIAVCCEEEVCGLAPQLQDILNDQENTNAPTEYVKYDVGRPFEVGLQLTSLADGSVQPFQFSHAWCSADRIITVQPPRFNQQEEVTITSGTDCCPVVCEPVCVDWNFLITDLDRNAIVTVLNPADIDSVTPGNGLGSWTQDPLDPNVWLYDNGAGGGNNNSNGSFRLFAQCDKPIIFSVDLLGGDCVGTQARVNSKRAVLLKYVCDPSINSNRISATLANGSTINVNSVEIP